MKHITLSTWNIGSLYIDFEKNISYLEDLITAYPQDILCMQEFPENNSLIENVMKWGGFTHFLFLKTSESHIQKESDMGVAVFSKWTINSLDVLQLPTPKESVSYKGKEECWHAKYFTAISCDIMEKKIILITGHGFPFHRYQLENPTSYYIIQPSFLALDTWIKELYEKYTSNGIYMAADFNITDPLLFMPFCKKHFFDAFAGDATRPSGRKTDAILLPASSEVLKKNNTKIQNGDMAIFDHNFISVAFEV